MSSPPGYNPDASMLPGAGGASVPMLKMSGGSSDNALTPEYKDGGYTQSMLNTPNADQAPPLVPMKGGDPPVTDDAEAPATAVPSEMIDQLSITEAEFNEAKDTNTTIDYKTFLSQIGSCRTAAETEGASSCAEVRTILRKIFINRLETYIAECQGFVATGTTAASLALQQAKAKAAQIPQYLKKDEVTGQYVAATKDEPGAFASSQHTFEPGAKPGQFKMTSQTPAVATTAAKTTTAITAAPAETVGLTGQKKELLEAIAIVPEGTQPPPPPVPETQAMANHRYEMVKAIMDLLSLLPQLGGNIPSLDINTYQYKTLNDLIGGINSILGYMTISQRTPERKAQLELYNIKVFNPINKKIGNAYRVPDEIGQKFSQFINTHPILNIKATNYNEIFDNICTSFLTFMPIIGNLKIYNKISADTSEGSPLDTLAAGFKKELGEGRILGRAKNYISIYIKRFADESKDPAYVSTLFAWRPDIAGVFEKDLKVGDKGASGAELVTAMVQTALKDDQKVEFTRERFDYLMKTLFSKFSFAKVDEDAFEALHTDIEAYDMLYNLFINPVNNPYSSSVGPFEKEIDYADKPKLLDDVINSYDDKNKDALIKMYIKSAFFGVVKTIEGQNEGLISAFMSLLGVNRDEEKMITLQDRIGLEQAFGEPSQKTFFDAVRTHLDNPKSDTSAITMESLNTIMDAISKGEPLPSIPEGASDEQLKQIYSAGAKIMIPLYDYIVAFYYITSDILPAAKEKGVIYNNFLKQLYVGLKRAGAPKSDILDVIETDSNRILYMKDIEDIQIYFEDALLKAAPDYVAYFLKVVLISNMFQIYDDMVTIPGVEDRAAAATSMYDYLLVFQEIWKYFTSKDTSIATKASTLHARINGDEYTSPDFIAKYKYAPMTEIKYINNANTALNVSDYFKNKTTAGDKKLVSYVVSKLNMDYIINDVLMPRLDNFNELKNDSSFTFEYKPLTKLDINNITQKDSFITNVFSIMKLMQILRDSGATDTDKLNDTQQELNVLLIDFYEQVFNKIWAKWTDISNNDAVKNLYGSNIDAIQDKLNGLNSPGVNIDLSTGNRDNFVKMLFFGEKKQRNDCRQLMKDMQNLFNKAMANEEAVLFTTLCDTDEFDIREIFNTMRNDTNVETQLWQYDAYSSEIKSKFAIQPNDIAKWEKNLATIMTNPDKENTFLLHLKEADDGLDDPPPYEDEINMIFLFLNVSPVATPVATPVAAPVATPVAAAEEEEEEEASSVSPTPSVEEEGENADEGNINEIALTGGAKKGKFGKSTVTAKASSAKASSTPTTATAKASSTTASSGTATSGTAPDAKIRKLDFSLLPPVVSTRGLQFIEYPSDILYGTKGSEERKIFINLMLALFARLLHNIINVGTISRDLHETYINTFFFMWNQFNTLMHQMDELNNTLYRTFNIFFELDEMKNFFAKYYQVYLKRTGKESNKGPQRLKYIADQLVINFPRKTDTTWFGGGINETIGEIEQSGGFGSFGIGILSALGIGVSTVAYKQGKKMYNDSIFAQQTFANMKGTLSTLFTSTTRTQAQIAASQRDLLINIVGVEPIKSALGILSAYNVEYDIIKEADASDIIKKLIMFRTSSIAGAAFYNEFNDTIRNLVIETNSKPSLDASKAIKDIVEMIRTGLRKIIIEKEKTIDNNQKILNGIKKLTPTPEQVENLRVVEETIDNLRAEITKINRDITMININDQDTLQKVQNVLSYSATDVQQFKFPEPKDIPKNDTDMWKFRDPHFANRVYDIIPFIGNLYNLMYVKKSEGVSGALQWIGLVPEPPVILTGSTKKEPANILTSLALLENVFYADPTNMNAYKDREKILIDFISYIKGNIDKVRDFLYDDSDPSKIGFWNFAFDAAKVNPAYFVNMESREVKSSDPSSKSLMLETTATLNIYMNSFDNLVNSYELYLAYKKFMKTTLEYFTTLIMTLKDPEVFNNVILKELKDTDMTMKSIQPFVGKKIEKNKFEATLKAQFKEFIKNPEGFIPLLSRLYAVLGHPCGEKYVAALKKQAGKGKSPYIIIANKLQIRPGSNYNKAYVYMQSFLKNTLSFTLPLDYCLAEDIRVGPSAQRIRYQMEKLVNIENEYILDNMSVNEFIGLRQNINLLFDSINDRYNSYMKKYNEIDALKKKQNPGNLKLPDLDNFKSKTDDELRYLAGLLYCIGRKAEVEFLSANRESAPDARYAQTPKEKERAAYWKNKLTEEQKNILSTFGKLSITAGGKTYTTADLQEITSYINLNKINIKAPPYMFLTTEQRKFAQRMCTKRIRTLQYHETISLITQLIASYEMVGVDHSNIVVGTITRNIDELQPDVHYKLQSASLVMRYGAPVQNFYLSKHSIYKTEEPITSTERLFPEIQNEVPVAGNFKYDLSKMYDRPDVKYNYTALLSSEEKEMEEEEALATEYAEYIKEQEDLSLFKSIVRDESPSEESETSPTEATGGKRLVERSKNRSTRRYTLRVSSRTRKHVN